MEDKYREDHRKRNNFTLGLHAEISVRVSAQVEKDLEVIKNDGRQEKKIQFGSSALFTRINN